MADLTHPTPEWMYTDDPDDPCVNCVQWRCPVDGSHDDLNCAWEHDWEPYWPDGSVVPRVFDGSCPRCAAAIAEYAARPDSNW